MHPISNIRNFKARFISGICKGCNRKVPRSIDRPKKSTDRIVPTPIKLLSNMNNKIRNVRLTLKLESAKLILKYLETPSMIVDVGALPQATSNRNAVPKPVINRPIKILMVFITLIFLIFK